MNSQGVQSVQRCAIDQLHTFASVTAGVLNKCASKTTILEVPPKLERRRLAGTEQLPIALSLIATAVLFPPHANSETLTLESALSDAVSSSFDLRIAAAETNIRRASLKSERADLMPQLRAAYSSEHLSSFNTNQQQSNTGSGTGRNNTSNAPTPVAVVGNTILAGNTRSQNVVSLNATQTLFDAGTKFQTIKAARLRIDSARIQQRAIIQDLKVSVVKAYAEALVSYLTLREHLDELRVYRDYYRIKKRFFDAEKISRVEVGEAAIQVQTAEDAVEQSRQDFIDTTAALVKLTHRQYDVNELRVAPIMVYDVPPLEKSALLARAPSVLAAEKEIRAARADLSAIKRQRYPQVGLYSGFVFYGADQNNWFASIGKMGPRQFNLGVNASFPIFDGWKTRAECMKKHFEIQKLEAMRDKKIAELSGEFDRLSATSDQYNVELKTKAKLVKDGEAQLSMVKRLSDSLVRDRSTVYHEQIAQLQKNLSEERTKHLRAAALVTMQILAEG